MTAKLNMIHPKKAVFLFLAVLMGSVSAVAQKNFQYDSIYNTSKVSYNTYFEYYLKKSDTIFHGPFTLHEEHTKADSTYSFVEKKGQYIHDVPDQKWKMLLGEFKLTEEGNYNKYGYTFKVNGEETELNGSFEKGKKNGLWELYQKKIVKSEIQDTLLFATLSYSDDTPVGTIKFGTTNTFAVGNLNNSGFPIEKWSLYSQNSSGKSSLIEEWVFNNMRLVQLNMMKGNNEITFEIEPKFNNDFLIEDISITKDYLEIISLQSSLNNPKQHDLYNPQQLNELLSLVINKFDDFSSVSQSRLASHLNINIKAKIKASPLEKVEIENIEEVSILYKETNSLLNRILNNPTIAKANKFSEEVLLLKNALRMIQEDYLQPIKGILTLHDKSRLKYFNRELLLQNWLQLPDENIVQNVSWKDTTYTSYTFNEPYDKEIHNFKDVAELTESILNEVNYINLQFQEYISEYKQEKRLVALESKLNQTYEHVDSLIDSLIHIQHESLAGFNVQSQLLNFTEELLYEYNELETNEKKKAVDPLIDCFEKLEKLILAIQHSPQKTATIRGSYTKQTFNPYTFTNMEERIKPEIFRVFNNILLPAIFEELKEINCDNIERSTLNFQNLFDKIMALLDERTDSIERQLKRVKQPQKANEILATGLKLND
ncbi:hypothetical protein GCM10011506_18250 [Marivirga lumbricoides]|uniref:Uncharacterized protein n=1 Tax=Marivirga lumbricoides TaxID=1046115 RepID=A0ABQ1M0R2_9BACT|nr:hypothetical protein GCM10011506_18250 [Marivirga lumbricoides]